MGNVSAADLDKVSNFEQLVNLLRYKLEWPIGEDYGFDDIVFEYEASELGLKKSETAKIREIHQLRPLATNQPWGIFFISMEDRTIPVTVLRRILKALVVKKRSGTHPADRRAWDKSDLIFAASFGRSGTRQLAFIHFSDGKKAGDLPVMKVLGWNAQDTVFKHDYVAATLRDRLVWPDDPKDTEAWRKTWASAFELRLNQVIKTSKELAIRLADLASDIRARVNQLIKAEEDTGPMRTMHAAFRKSLIDDLDNEGFADMFAQTIAYGMLAARISRPMGIVADTLADTVPRTNPFLKELFGNFLKIGGRDERTGLDFDELGIRDVVDLLNDADMEAVLRDFGDRNPKEDPVIHFYELFLKEYDPKKRMQRGVFYTPRPVVNFIVRGVDDVLRSEFGLPLGLADTSTWAEVAARNDRITISGRVPPDAPFVHVLDLATGTGTFLVEVIDLIHKRMEEHWRAQGKSASAIKAEWNTYVPKHLLPRLTAFELMMAPYTIAHLKVGLKLSETGYTFGSDERARIFLTNALEPTRDLDMEFDFMSEALAHEAHAANSAKDRTPFTVVVGNPPYASLSANLTPELRRIVDSYRNVDGSKIRERNMLQFEKNIQDDYVKFFRLAEREASRNHGIMSLITNHGYIDAPTLRGMRWHLSKSFSTIEVIDLHGNSNKNETLSSGYVDKNIFPIKQGVAIVRARGSKRLSQVTWGELWGEGGDKEERLFSGSWKDFLSSKVSFGAPNYLFVPRSTGPVETEWLLGRAVNQVFPLFSSGVESGFDDLLIDFDRSSLVKKLKDFDAMGRDQAIEAFDAKKGNARRIIDKRTKVLPLAKDISPLQKHAFDFRVLLATKRLLKTNGENVFSNIDSAQPGLVTTRQTKEGFGALAVAERCGHKLTTSYDRVSVFPLWLKPSVGEPLRRPNIDYALAQDFGKTIGLTYEDGIARGEQRSFGPSFQRPEIERRGLLDTPWDGRGNLAKTFGPRDLFDYIYAILHSPGYRNRYVEFLKSNFPHIPTPKDLVTFADLVPLGRKLVALHLLRQGEASILEQPEIRFAGPGEARVEMGYPKYDNGKVMINGTRWFEDVPQTTWEFHVGGYQVCKKWLNDRARKGGKKARPGKALTNEDILHYRRIVAALTETQNVMVEIDKVIEKQGGWPGAFRTDG